jgi:Family of unknown function (DUF6174)
MTRAPQEGDLNQELDRRSRGAGRGRGRALLALVEIGLVLGACAESTSPTSPDSDDRQATVAAFGQARDVWRRKGPRSYRYVFQQICFCAPPVTDPVVITVQNGLVTRVAKEATGAPVDEADLSRYLSIDGLFQRIQDAIDAHADEIRVSYDPALAYPTDVLLDPSHKIADEEVRYQARDLQPLGD